MMKLRIPPRNLLDPTDPNRPILSYTLHPRHNHSLFISHTHLPRCKLWLNHPIHTRKWSLHILHLPIHTHRTRTILRLLHIYRNMKHRHYPPIHHYSHSIHRLRTAMRTNIILRSNRHYQPTISSPLCRRRPSTMNLRRIFNRQSNPNTILRPPLYPTIRSTSTSSSTSTIPTRNRIQQPLWNPIRFRQNPIPPILHNQRYLRSPTSYSNPNTISVILTRLIRRPRQLHPCQPPKHPTTY